MSVEGIWEGLKVFERAGVDREVMGNGGMKGMQRTEKRFGQLLGWSKGLKGHSRGLPLLDVNQARRKILMASYKYGNTHRRPHPHPPTQTQTHFSQASQ